MCTEEKCAVHVTHRAKINREANTDFVFLAANIFGLILLVRKKSSQVAADVCKSKNQQFSVDINNIFLLVSLDEGMEQGFTCMRNVCYRRKARVLLKKVFAYPFLCMQLYLSLTRWHAIFQTKATKQKTLSSLQPEIFMVNFLAT